MRIRRRHPKVRVGGGDPFQEHGNLRFAGNDGKSAFCHMQWGVGAIGDIETQMCFPVIGIGTVAFETFIRKDGADIEVVAHQIRKSSGFRAAVMTEARGSKTDRAGNGYNNGKTSGPHTLVTSYK